MGGPLRVMLIDDHAVVRTGYRRLLELEGDIEVAAEAADADTAFDWLQRHDGRAVELLVLDLSMPGRSAFELLRRARLHWPWLRWLVFSMHDGAGVVAQALRAGADGFVSKSSAPEEMVRCLRRVAAGETGVLAEGLDAGPPAPRPPHLELSPREFEVLQLLLQGLSPAQIGQRLHLSAKTVSNVQTRIRARLGVGSTVELVRYAQQYRLFTA